MTGSDGCCRIQMNRSSMKGVSFMQNGSKKKYPVERMDISINMEKTGAHIKRSIKESGYTLREIMEITGITTEQTIYKWYSGKSIPSLETQIILCKLLGLRITELLVIDGEFDFPDGDDHTDGSDIYTITEHHNKQQIKDDRIRRIKAYCDRIGSLTA